MKNLLLAALCLTAPSVASPQEPTPSRPQATFRSAVDLVAVDVNVIDSDGRPVEGLNASDFALTVDGKPRRIVSAEFVRTSGDAAAPPSSRYYSSNVQGGAGRLVMLVIDQGNISAGRGRFATESAIRFIKRLSPRDRVGLFAIPGAGPRVNFTANHDLIRAELPKVVGHATENLGAQRVSPGEAARVERGDQFLLNAIADRECTATDRQVCMQELAAEAREVFGDSRDRGRNSLAALRHLMQQLSESSSPKTVVYLAETLVIDEGSAELAWLGPLAAKGRVSLYVLRIDRPTSDAGSPRSSSNRREDAALAEEGLSRLASLARGSLFRLVGNADNAFDRLTREISASYILGFEPEPSDRDGTPHKIRIELPGRRGIQIRARPEFNAEAVREIADEKAVVATLRAPLLATDIGLKVTTYTFREADSQKLRIVIAAEIDRSQNPAARVALGYAITDPLGRIVASQYESHVKTLVRGATNAQHFVAASAIDAPGAYVLKLAVVDDAGKRGSVEHAFQARLTSAGQLRTADLLLAESATVHSDGVVPTVAGDFAAPDLHAYLELYSDSAEALNAATVTLEVASREDSRSLDSASAHVNEASSTSSRRVAEAVLPIGLLPPGDYVARAVVSTAGRRAAHVVRPFRIVRPSSTVTANAGGIGRGRRSSPVPFAYRIEGFDRGAVLTPQIVGFFLDRMNAASRTPAPVAAIELARTGKFDAALKAVTAPGTELAAAFLQGMALFARGDLEAAADQFREALRRDSEFFAAAFYLGACYAAGGRDRDASAAWQTSLVTESDAPFIYTLLADALLRQREIDKAIDILNEAATIWPDEPEVEKRLSTALAMSGKTADALKVLDSYLAKRPSDAERLFMALRVIYEAHAEGRTIGGASEDRRRFERYAAAYGAAGGPQQALVNEWKKFMAGR